MSYYFFLLSFLLACCYQPSNQSQTKDVRSKKFFSLDEEWIGPIFANINGETRKTILHCEKGSIFDPFMKENRNLNLADGAPEMFASDEEATQFIADKVDRINGCSLIMLVSDSPTFASEKELIGAKACIASILQSNLNDSDMGNAVMTGIFSTVSPIDAINYVFSEKENRAYAETAKYKQFSQVINSISLGWNYWNINKCVVIPFMQPT